MEIYAIMDGHVLPYILDPNFEKYLPIIPSEVGDLHDFQQGKNIRKCELTQDSGRTYIPCNIKLFCSANCAGLLNAAFSKRSNIFEWKF